MNQSMIEVILEPEKATKNYHKFNEVNKQHTTGGIYISRNDLEALGWKPDDKVKIEITLA